MHGALQRTNRDGNALLKRPSLFFALAGALLLAGCSTCTEPRNPKPGYAEIDWTGTSNLPATEKTLHDLGWAKKANTTGDYAKNVTDGQLVLRLSASATDTHITLTHPFPVLDAKAAEEKVAPHVKPLLEALGPILGEPQTVQYRGPLSACERVK